MHARFAGTRNLLLRRTSKCRTNSNKDNDGPRVEYQLESAWFQANLVGAEGDGDPGDDLGILGDDTGVEARNAAPPVDLAEHVRVAGVLPALPVLSLQLQGQRTAICWQRCIHAGPI